MREAYQDPAHPRHGARRRRSAPGRALLAGALGLLALDSPAEGATRLPSSESSIGVWYQPGAPASGKLWRPGDPGRRLFLRGRVLTVANRPVAGARVEIWHADAAGVVHADRYRAALTTPADGSFRIDTVLPGYIWGPRHIHVVITHPGHPRFITRIFFKRDPVVAESGRPELAIHLEDGRTGGTPALLGEIELILSPR